MNKQLINVSERDKKLLMLMIMVLVAFLCYYFILNPALMKGSLLKSQYEEAKSENHRVEAVINKLPDLKKEEVSRKQQLQEKYKQFFYEINEARILYKLNTTITAAGFPADSVAFSRASAAEIDVDASDYEPLIYPLYVNATKTNPTLAIPKKETGDADQTNQPQQQSQNSIPKDSVAYSDITIGFASSSYEAIYNFLKKLEELDRSIVVKNVTIAKSIETNGIKGEIVLGVYSLAKPNASDSSDLQFDLVLPKGKPNPFLQ